MIWCQKWRTQKRSLFNRRRERTHLNKWVEFQKRTIPTKESKNRLTREIWEKTFPKKGLSHQHLETEIVDLQEVREIPLPKLHQKAPPPKEAILKIKDLIDRGRVIEVTTTMIRTSVGKDTKEESQRVAVGETAAEVAIAATMVAAMAKVVEIEIIIRADDQFKQNN
jgi:hypothetical protein